MLEDFVQDSDIVEKVTLLYSFSVGNEFKRLPFQSMAMDNIFRNSSPGSSTVATIPKFRSDSTTKKAVASVPKSWATLAKGEQINGNVSVSPNATISFAPQLLVNATGQRIDQKLPKPSQAAINSWNYKIKVAKMRYCRMYQLNNNCPGGCGYAHGPLSDEEKLVLRRNLRDEKCYDKLECRDVNCLYRHNCNCTQTNCKFPKSMHKIDDTTARAWAEC